MCFVCFSEHAEKYGFGVVERFVGHGVGTVFHSEPIILHHRKYSSDFNIYYLLFSPLNVLSTDARL